ncbi:hypothetical protein GUJ93_ZPchr0013g35297 [Zizania palustris]|uniref:Uncharacterized protein n=1 Tax=Zizania palustris TaxID=103762 RepID=A0A8J6BXY3_ZIZPA|nr:hypothetical protein GUJ93_ZPchr0013g35297 [Zizania palustris]
MGRNGLKAEYEGMARLPSPAPSSSFLRLLQATACPHRSAAAETPPASDGESYSHGDSDSSSSEVSAYLGHSHHLAPTICRRRNGETPPLASDGESYSHCDSDSSSSEVSAPCS